MDDVGVAAFSEILKGGVLGAMLVLALAAIVYLFIALISAHKAFGEREIKRGAEVAADSKATTQALVQVAEVVRGSTAAQEKSGDSHRALAESNRILADAVNRMMNWAERTRA